MIKHFDHVTIVVRDVEAAKQFFGLLGFKEDKSVVIRDPQVSTYMGVDGIEADDLEAEVATLKATGIQLRNEVMHFHNRKLVFLSGPEGVTVELAECG
jgi:hypothetical protein